MAKYVFPNFSVQGSVTSFDPNTGLHVSTFTRAIQTKARDGERWLAQIQLRNLKGIKRRQVEAFRARLNGQEHRAYVRDHSYKGPNGALTIAELVDIAFNASFWEIQTTAEYGAIHDITGAIRFVQGREHVAPVIRPSTAADGISTPVVGRSYVAVMAALNQKSSPGGSTVPTVSLGWRDASFGNILASSSSVSDADRLVVAATCPDTAAFFLRPTVGGTATDITGSAVDVAQLSASRCLLVDNGVNALTRSEEFDHADWTKTAMTVTADDIDAPDGETTADKIIPSVDNVVHNIAQTVANSGSNFWTFSVHAVAAEEDQLFLILFNDSDTGEFARIAFNLATGTTYSEGAGAPFTTSMLYSSMHDLGNGVYRCRLSALVDSSITTIRAVAYVRTSASFAGNGSDGLHLWGAQMQQGGQLGRYIATTSAAATAESQTGREIWLKGLDSNVPAQLLEGNQVEINGQLLVLQSDLDGDASGVGLARVYPGIRTAPADEDPAILYRPNGLFLLENPATSFSNRPGIQTVSDSTLEFVEDIVA